MTTNSNLSEKPRVARSSFLYQPCPKGTFCLEGASNTTTCPAGHYCQEKTKDPVICPRGYFCPYGSSDPTACVLGTYCPEGSEMFTSCPLGWHGSLSSNNTLGSRDEACKEVCREGGVVGREGGWLILLLMI